MLADALPDEPALADALLVCATEITTSDEIGRFADAPCGEVLGEPRPSRAGHASRRRRPDERHRPRAPADPLRALQAGRGGGKIPHPPRERSTGSRPTSSGRAAHALPELNEPEVVRHYVNLSQLNFAVDTGFYPLGSCTMKFNPKINEWAARLPGFANLHPLAPDELAQGTLGLLWELEDSLAEVSGMRAVTLQPAAGAQGELTGILMIRAYHRQPRRHWSGPRSSFPTRRTAPTPRRRRWPASRRSRSRPRPTAASTSRRFRGALGPRTAAVMITNPSTLGLFESRIGELLDAVHAAGALAYMDGANLNAILGRFKPGEAGFDVMHINTHKTFSTPHGGGGPGAGPVGVGEKLVPFLPSPRVLREDDGSFRLERAGRAPDVDRAGALVRRQHRRARARLRLHAAPTAARGLREVTDDAVLAANYLKHGSRARSTSRTTRPASTSSWPRRRRSRSGPASGRSTSPSG